MKQETIEVLKQILPDFFPDKKVWTRIPVSENLQQGKKGTAWSDCKKFYDLQVDFNERVGSGRAERLDHGWQKFLVEKNIKRSYRCIQYDINAWELVLRLDLEEHYYNGGFMPPPRTAAFLKTRLDSNNLNNIQKEKLLALAKQLFCRDSTLKLIELQRLFGQIVQKSIESDFSI